MCLVGLLESKMIKKFISSQPFQVQHCRVEQLKKIREIQAPRLASLMDLLARLNGQMASMGAAEFLMARSVFLTACHFERTSKCGEADQAKNESFGIQLRRRLGLWERFCDRPIVDVAFILAAHKMLTSQSTRLNHDVVPGAFRQSDVRIFKTSSTSPVSVLACTMSSWVTKDVDRLLSDFDRCCQADAQERLLSLPLFYYNFIATHPFMDGNGRTMRSLFPYLAQQAKLTAAPLWWIDPFVAMKKTAHNRALLESDLVKHVGPWMEFCLQTMEAVLADQVAALAHFQRLAKALGSRLPPGAATREVGRSLILKRVFEGDPPMADLHRVFLDMAGPGGIEDLMRDLRLGCPYP